MSVVTNNLDQTDALTELSVNILALYAYCSSVSCFSVKTHMKTYDVLLVTVNSDNYYDAEKLVRAINSSRLD